MYTSAGVFSRINTKQHNQRYEMKTKLFTTLMAALAVMASFFPSQSLAQYQVTTPTWEQVGMYYGNFVQTLYGGGDSNYGFGRLRKGFSSSKSIDGLEDIMYQSLADTYGTNVGYFYYFSALAQNFYSDASLYVLLGISYAEYLVQYYAYLYYLSPDYVNQLADYFYNYISTQESSFYDFLYDDNSLFSYYQDVAYYYYGLVYPETNEV